MGIEPDVAAAGPMAVFFVPIVCFFVGHLIHKYHLVWLPESVGTMFGMCPNLLLNDIKTQKKNNNNNSVVNILCSGVLLWSCPLSLFTFP